MLTPLSGRACEHAPQHSVHKRKLTLLQWVQAAVSCIDGAVVKASRRGGSQRAPIPSSLFVSLVMGWHACACVPPWSWVGLSVDWVGILSVCLPGLACTCMCTQRRQCADMPCYLHSPHQLRLCACLPAATCPAAAACTAALRSQAVCGPQRLAPGTHL